MVPHISYPMPSCDVPNTGKKRKKIIYKPKADDGGVLTYLAKEESSHAKK